MPHIRPTNGFRQIKGGEIKGYIYVRTHESYDIHDACKIGITNNIPERDSTYTTGEIKRGQFVLVFEVPIQITSIIERLLQNEFKKEQILDDGGTEFFNKNIMNQI